MQERRVGGGGTQLVDVLVVLVLVLVVVAWGLCGERGCWRRWCWLVVVEWW
jgi:hypothetical protein